MKGKLLHMVSNIQRPAMNKLKTIFFLEKIFDNEEHEHYQYKLLPGQKHTLSFVFVFVFELEFLFFICCDTNCGDSQKSFLLHCCQMI